MPLSPEPSWGPLVVHPYNHPTGTSIDPLSGSPSAEGALLYIHPYNHPNDFVVPTGLIGLMNRVKVPKLGRYSSELTEEEVRSARCFALDLHWFFSIDALRAITGDLRRLNPNAPIIVGGITASFYCTYLMENYPIDFLVQGDAEYTFPRLIDCIFEGRPVPPLPNLHRREGPPAERRKVTPEELDESDHLTMDWFPSLLRHTREGHRRYAEQPFWDLDHFHPFLTLNRGCRFPCNFCFGAYQKDVFGPGQVERGVEALGRMLDRIEADPGLHFVNLLFGTEDVDRLDVYRPVFEKRRSLAMGIMFCELPRIDQIQMLLDGFERCVFDFTNPAEIPFPLAAKRWTIEQANDRLVELVRFLDGRGDSRACVSFMSREPSAFRDRLRAEGLQTVTVKDNFEWNLPKPNWKTLPRGYRPDKTGQAEHFRGVSRGFSNYIVARALAPALYPVLDFPRFVSFRPLATLDTGHPGLARFHESYMATYAERCVTTLEEVTVGLRLLEQAGHCETGAALACEALPDERGSVLGAATATPRFNGIHVDFEGELPTASLRGGARIAIAPRLSHGGAAVDLAEVEGLPLWTLRLPASTLEGEAARLRIHARVHQEVCQMQVWLAGELLIDERWGFFEARPDSPVFRLELEPPRQRRGPAGPPPQPTEDTPEAIIDQVARGSFAAPGHGVALKELITRLAAQPSLGRWSTTLLTENPRGICWELRHPEAGRLWMFAVPPGTERYFVRGRHVDLFYRTMDKGVQDSPQLRQLLESFAGAVESHGRRHS